MPQLCRSQQSPPLHNPIFFPSFPYLKLSKSKWNTMFLLANNPLLNGFYFPLKDCARISRDVIAYLVPKSQSDRCNPCRHTCRQRDDGKCSCPHSTAGHPCIQRLVRLMETVKHSRPILHSYGHLFVLEYLILLFLQDRFE